MLQLVKCLGPVNIQHHSEAAIGDQPCEPFCAANCNARNFLARWQVHFDIDQQAFVGFGPFGEFSADRFVKTTGLELTAGIGKLGLNEAIAAL